jgi:phosphate transport system substrate-binding protein
LAAGTHLQLSGTVLSAIYQGKITMWDDPQIEALNKGVKLPAEKIVALHRSDSSGDTFLFSTYLSDADPKGWGNSVGYGTSISFPSISNAQGETGNSGMVSGCRTIPGCIAYIGISYKSDTQSAKLGEAALENGDGKYELPTPNTIDAEAAAFTAKTPADEAISMIYGKTPDGYPIINYEYAIVPAKEQNTTVAGAVKGFLEWAVSPSGGNSAMYLGQVGFQPLPAPVLKLSDALITKIS